MEKLGLGSMVGNYIGKKTVEAQKADGEPGFNGQHPICCGFKKLYEGVTVAGLPEALLSPPHEGWVEIMRATDKRLLTAYFEDPAGDRGPMVLHGAFTQLFTNLIQQAGAVGQDVFIRNLGTYTALRSGDISIVKNV